jgi:hypothetical protein
VRFNLTPFYRGYDFDALDRTQRLPVPPNPSLSIGDPQWRETHAAQMAGTRLGEHRPALRNAS